MPAFEQRLGQFAQDAAPAIDELMEAVASASATDSTETAQALLKRYIPLTQRIASLAAQCGLAGLHSVCALVETNLLLLQDDPRPLSAEESAMLEAWPMLLLGYAANHAEIGRAHV